MYGLEEEFLDNRVPEMVGRQIRHPVKGPGCHGAVLVTGGHHGLGILHSGHHHRQNLAHGLVAKSAETFLELNPGNPVCSLIIHSGEFPNLACQQILLVIASERIDEMPQAEGELPFILFLRKERVESKHLLGKELRKTGYCNVALDGRVVHRVPFRFFLEKELENLIRAHLLTELQLGCKCTFFLQSDGTFHTCFERP